MPDAVPVRYADDALVVVDKPAGLLAVPGRGPERQDCVAARVRSYGLPLSEAARAYVERLWASPGVSAWVADALAEHDFIAEDEPYRSAP